MRKIGIAICALLVLVLLLSACGGQSTSVGGPEPAEPVENTGNVDVKEDGGEVTTPEVTVPEEPTPEPVAEDPLEGLLMSETAVAETGGLYLLRNEKYYSLDSIVGTKTTDFKYGRMVQPGLRLYETITRADLISFGEVPVPVLKASDKIVMFSTSGDVPRLALSRVVFKGYTVPFVEEGSAFRLYDLDNHTENNYIKKNKSDINNLTICDSSENVVADKRDLEYGADYIVSWFVGTQYEEMASKANCSFYEVEEGSSMLLDGTLTKNGYIEFDLFNLPAGLYTFGGVGSGGLLEIR